MSALPSIRQRLSQSLLVVSLVWGLAVSAVVWLVVRHEVDELMDATLQEAAEVLYGVMSPELARRPSEPGGALPAPLHDEGLSWQVVSTGPVLVMRSHRASAAPWRDHRASGFFSVQTWRIYAMPLPAERVLMVAQPLSSRTSARLDVALYSAGAALAVGWLCALWLRQLLRRELAPVTALARDVAAFDPLQPRAQLAPAQRSELLPMHRSVSGLGRRLAARVHSERAFAAHAAHALRTPLAGMVAQLATAQRMAPADIQPMLALARQAANRLRGVAAAVLALFRADSELRWQEVRLPELMAQLPVEGLQVSADAAPGLRADVDLLAAALANLLDNASRHGAQAAHLSAQFEAGSWRLALHDDGPGMNEVRRQALQQALDAQAYAGQTGLGLMLADRVARAHGGVLAILPTASGFAVELRWPALSSEPVQLDV